MLRLTSNGLPTYTNPPELQQEQKGTKIMFTRWTTTIRNSLEKRTAALLTHRIRRYCCTPHHRLPTGSNQTLLFITLRNHSSKRSVKTNLINIYLRYFTRKRFIKNFSIFNYALLMYLMTTNTGPRLRVSGRQAVSHPISFIQVVCLTTGPKPLPKRALHIVRSRASSFK